MLLSRERIVRIPRGMSPDVNREALFKIQGLRLHPVITYEGAKHLGGLSGKLFGQGVISSARGRGALLLPIAVGAADRTDALPLTLLLA